MINLRLEAASDVQECLATLRSLTSRRTEAQRRAMPLRPGKGSRHCYVSLLAFLFLFFLLAFLFLFFLLAFSFLVLLAGLFFLLAFLFLFFLLAFLRTLKPHVRPTAPMQCSWSRMEVPLLALLLLRSRPIALGVQLSI